VKKNKGFIMSGYKKRKIKKEIKDFLNMQAIDKTSLFGVYIVDINTYEIEYVNQAVKNIMADSNAKYCWEAIYGLDAPCPWCKIPQLVNQYNKSNDKSILSEHFNEVNDKWYQLQDQVIDISETLTIKNAFAIDISLQKEAQGELIKSNVKLSLQSNELKQAHLELKELSNRDPLTNMHNRRYLTEISNELYFLAKRENTQLSVLMIDIDKFKNINDTYGHDIGDEVIKLLANTLTLNLREADVTARLGGEEFVIILPLTNVQNAQIKAQELRKTIQYLAQPVDDSTELTFTVSIGVSSYDAKIDTNFEDILKKADNALYEAKEKGRNMVVSH